MKTILGKIGAGAAVIFSVGGIILYSIMGQDALILKNENERSQVPWTAPIQTELLKRGLAAYAFQLNSEFDSVVYTKSNMKFDSVLHGDSIILIPSDPGWRPDSIRVYRTGWVKYRSVNDTLVCVDPIHGLYEEKDVDCYRKEIISDPAINERLIPETYALNIVIKRPKSKKLTRRVRLVPK